MKVRLDRKLAERLNGVDLSSASAGQVLELSGREAELLVAEGWASRVESSPPAAPPRTPASLAGQPPSWPPAK